MGIYFDDSRPDRKKRALKENGTQRARLLESSPIPPAKKYELLTYEEFHNGGDRSLSFDVESYPNYFECGFKCMATGKVVVFEETWQGHFINGSAVSHATFMLELAFALCRFRLIGFNSRTYDLPITYCALAGVRAPMLNTITVEIIKQELQAYEVERKYCRNVPTVNHIDLIEVAPLQASLKMYAGRLHCDRMQDLPFPPETVLQDWQVQVVRDYNINDLDNNILLFNHLEPQITLREEIGKVYNVDLRSKSDAQIAETVIGSELRKIGVTAKAPKLDRDYTFHYKVPEFIQFKTPKFQELLRFVASIPFGLSEGGHPAFPADLPSLPHSDLIKVKRGSKEESYSIQVEFQNNSYKVGLGGLHSNEESVYYKADEHNLLIDRDVASFYPYIILNQGLAPLHLGDAFLKVFRDIVNQRIAAKREGRKLEADSLKITINGTFGKLGNRYSLFYSPDMLIQVTMSGQLCLLMLIEAVELAGFEVVSGNTDGIVIKCPKEREKELEAVVIIWEEATGLITEETRYKALYSRDVNNYIAFTLDGKAKLKGAFSEVGSALNSPLSKNPEAYICSMAVQKFLGEGVPIEETITNCRDLTKFISVKNVKGGGEKDGIFLGKSVRWYYAQGETGAIRYIASGNTVGKSEGAKPCMNLPEAFPNDIDFDRYINDATGMLYDLGVLKKAKTERLI